MKSKGFSLVELLVSMAIATFMISIFTQVFIRTNKDFQYEAKKLDVLTEIQTAYSILFNDIYSSQSSMGMLMKKDDNNKNFFDYYPDYSSHFLGHPSRKLTLSISKSGDQSIVFLVSEPEVLRLHVGNLYSYSSHENLFSGPPTTVLEFNTKGQLRAQIRKEHSSWWSNNKILLFFVPSFFRKPSSTGVNMKTPPKMPSWLGKVSGKKVLKTIGSPSFFDFSSPVPYMTRDYGNFRNFIENIPLLGGGVPVVLTQSVSLLVYSLKKIKEGGKTAGKIYRCIGEARELNKLDQCGSSRFPGQMIMSNVNELIFKREDVSTTFVSVEIVPLIER